MTTPALIALSILLYLLIGLMIAAMVAATHHHTHGHPIPPRAQLLRALARRTLLWPLGALSALLLVLLWSVSGGSPARADIHRDIRYTGTDGGRS